LRAMTMMQSAGAWDSGEVVSIGMVYGQAQLLEAKRKAELQERALSGQEQDAIQQRRADATERVSSRSIEAERRGTAEAELRGKLPQQTATDSSEERTADEVQQISVEHREPCPGTPHKQTSLKGQKTDVDGELLAKLSKREAAALQDDESVAVAANSTPVKMAHARHEASKQMVSTGMVPGQAGLEDARRQAKLQECASSGEELQFATSVSTQNSGDETQRQVRFRTYISEYDVTTPYAVVYGDGHHPKDFDFDCSGGKIPKQNPFCM